MLHVYSLSAVLTEAIWYPHSAFTSLEISGILDLAGLAVAIWTLWTAFSLPLGGQLKYSYRCIAWGILSFAASHLLDSFIQGTQVLGSQQGAIVIQTAVPASILFFVRGLTGIGEALPGFFSDNHKNPLGLIWLLAVNLLVVVGAFSFIFYGFSTEAAVVALIGLEGGLLILTGLCVVLLVRARLRGIIGRSLWLAMLGLLIFSLAHPLQVWLSETTNISGDFLALLHRLIVMPALILFAVSITRLAHQLNQMLLPATPAPKEGQTTALKEEQPAPLQRTRMIAGPRVSERRPRKRLTAGTGDW